MREYNIQAKKEAVGEDKLFFGHPMFRPRHFICFKRLAFISAKDLRGRAHPPANYRKRSLMMDYVSGIDTS